MPVNIHGTTGITTPGMESTAMPTVGGDAVVESGSNSDGEWTRWADGTQIVTRTANGTGRAYYLYAVPFISSPFPLAGLEGGSDSTVAYTTDISSPHLPENGHGVVFRDSANGALQTNNRNAFVVATGRWK